MAVKQNSTLEAPVLSLIDARIALDEVYGPRPERDDPTELHGSDLSDCVLAVWARRNGKRLLPFTPRTLRRFNLGHYVEAEVLDALGRKHGKALIHNPDLRVFFRLVDGKIGHNRIVLDKTVKPEPDEIVGHPDAILVDEDDPLDVKVVYEVKSTLFFYDKDPETGRRVYRPDAKPAEQYVIQASTYGLALGAEQAYIIVSCVHSQEVSPMTSAYLFDPRKHAGRIAALADQHLRKTAPGSPPPAPEPPEYARRSDGSNWRCDFCRYAECPNNNNPERLSIA